MSLRKLCFYAMLATMLTFAVAEKLNRPVRVFDVPEMDPWANGRSFAASFRAESEMQPADFLPVQSKNAKSLGAGKLLVASRNLGDPLFAKTVILLVRYDAQGVLGLFLNRRTAIPLSRALESVKAAKDRSDPVYLGGPVETPVVFALFQAPAKIEGAEQIFDGVYLISSKPLFEQTISARPDASVFHVYLGYAGWTQNQLKKEVELGAWFIFPAEASTVFNADPDSLWLEMIRKTELQLTRSEPGDADPRTRASKFAGLSCKRWNSTHAGPVPPLTLAPPAHFPSAKSAPRMNIRKSVRIPEGCCELVDPGKGGWYRSMSSMAILQQVQDCARGIAARRMTFK